MAEILDADLHVHSCLSPCGDLLLSPRAIVEAASQRGLHMVALCDHNSAENVPAALRAATGAAVTVIPGMEVNTQEEVHVVTLFPDEESVLRMQTVVYDRLLPGKNDERLFGRQVIVNEHDEVEGFNDRLLIGATSLPLEELVDTVHSFGGVAIASHIDRETFGLIGQLGMIPPGLPLDAVEVSRHSDTRSARTLLPGCEQLAIVRGSDAHKVDEIGTVATRLKIEAPTFDELRLALRREEGRAVLEE